MMIVEASEFGAMLFDVYERESALDCPQLSVIEEVHEVDHPFADEILRAICYIYDAQSPLVSSFPDIALRKNYACEIAGFDPANELHQQVAGALKELDSEALSFDVPGVICAILRAQDKQLWTMIVSLDESFYEYQRILMTPSTTAEEKDLMLAVERKAKLHVACAEIVDRLKGYRREFFRGDDALQRKVRGSRFTPEAIARARRA